LWLLLQLSDTSTAAAVTFLLNGDTVSVRDDHVTSLLDALREQVRCRSVKDGCSPQGQCGCCTVWVDGSPRVACVTAVRRVAGRSVTTVEGLDPELRSRWAGAFADAGASQCGFCTPGILLRLASLEAGSRPVTRQAVESALLAHLCRCTGWQSIVEAACAALGLDGLDGPEHPGSDEAARAPDPLLASWRAQIEGPAFQSSGSDVVLGGGGFADDSAPAGALVQLGAAETAPADSLGAARAGTVKVQGRNSTVPLVHPVTVPAGEWALTLQTTWVEPAYLEPDASWCRPDGPPASPLANGGAFGGKRRSPVVARARTLAAELQSPVRVLWSREDVVRYGPKRPPLALALRPDGSGVVRIGRTPGSPDLYELEERLSRVAPDVVVEEVDIAGPPVALELRGAVWVEVLAARHALAGRRTEGSGDGTGSADVTVPGGGRAAVSVHTGAGGGLSGRGTVSVEVWAGELLDPVTLRSYVVGAVHQALGLVWSEGIAVDAAGVPLDLTIRSFGILAAREMPQVEVTLHADDRWPVNGSDAVFAATVAAAWIAEGVPPRWPTRRGGVEHHRRVAGSSGGSRSHGDGSGQDREEKR
jgi:aerobic-type carbon monoxide dehydrogenase small subunit (CoxS/CutS family)